MLRFSTWSQHGRHYFLVIVKAKINIKHKVLFHIIKEWRFNKCVILMMIASSRPRLYILYYLLSSHGVRSMTPYQNLPFFFFFCWIHYKKLILHHFFPSAFQNRRNRPAYTHSSAFRNHWYRSTYYSRSKPVLSKLLL